MDGPDDLSVMYKESSSDSPTNMVIADTGFWLALANRADTGTTTSLERAYPRSRSLW